MKSLRVEFAAILLGLLCVAASPLATAQPQSQQNESVADAARRARQQKKVAPKQDRVWDNDTLPTNGAGVNIVGPTSPAAEAPSSENVPVVRTASTPAASSASPASNDPQAIEKQRIETTAAMNELKDQLIEAQKVLDVAQRSFDLQRDTYYSKTNFAEDRAGKARLDAMQADILAKQAAVETLKAKLAALEDKLRALPQAPARQEHAPPQRLETAPPAPPRPPPVPPIHRPDSDR